MQVFATRKPIAQNMDLRLNCLFTKYRMTVRIMKLTSIILLAACLQLSARGTTQTVTLSVKDAPLLSVLKAIEKQTDFVFFVNSKELQKTKKISITANNLPLLQVLDMCFKDQPLTYTITGKWINIVPRIVKVENDDKTSSTSPLPKTIDIRGRVLNEKGEPVLASITVKGSTKGTATNKDGYFVLTGLEENAILIISGVGIETTEVKADGKTMLNIIVKIEVRPLDEVQMIAYGSTTKRFNTGNITSVKAADIERQPINNPLLALQGRVPGLIINQVNGRTGGPVNVQIQGRSSLGSSNDPFYVIDGVPYPSQLPVAIGGTTLGNPTSGGSYGDGNPLFYINPSDIESIEVLKDADATSIYGSRAANGAILITTKKGKEGRPKFDFNIQQGWGKVANKMDMMNTQQYVQMRREAFSNSGGTQTLSNAKDLIAWDTTSFTDWQDELIGGTAKYSNISASTSGGSSTIQYFVGGTYQRQTTVYPRELDDQSGTIHFNLSANSKNQRYHFGLTGSYMMDRNKLPYIDLTETAVLLAPDAPSLHNPDGTLNWGLTSSGVYTFNNPLGKLLYQTYTNKTSNLTSNAVMSYDIGHGLEIKSNLGCTNMQTNEFVTIPLVSYRPDLRSTSQREAYFSTRNINTWIIEPQIKYKNRVSKGNLEVLLGSTFQQNNSYTQSVFASGFTSDQLLQTAQSAPTISVINSYNFFKYNAFFGRGNFNWDNKYILNISARRDGSSRFGDKNKFHNFGSLSGGWIFSEEKAIKKFIPFLSFGKLKASYGTTGNDAIADYAFISAYQATTAGVPYQNTTGLYVDRIANPYVQWEETRKLMAGISLGFFSDQIVLDISRSRNRSSNQLSFYTLPTLTGFTGINYYNFPALIQNTDWEFSFTATPLKNKNFQWEINGNLTIPKNKLVSFPNIEKTSYASGNNGVIIGQPLGVQKIFHYTGIDPATGLYTVADPNGNPTSTPNFTTGYTGMVAPFQKYYGGFENKVHYKGFELDFLFQFVKQIGLDIFGYYNGSYTPGRFNVNGTNNQPAAAFDNHWSKPGDNSSIQKYGTNQLGPLVASSDAAYSTSPSFLRLKTASLSWSLPHKIIERCRFQSAKFYILGRNLFTVTKFKGLDPETGSSFVLPPLRVITVGLQASF